MNIQYTNVNLHDPRQDVNKIRKHNPELFRYYVAEKLLPEVQNSCSVLEIGGGTGSMSERMRKRGFNVTFTDLNPHSIKKAEENGFECFQLDSYTAIVRIYLSHFVKCLICQ